MGGWPAGKPTALRPVMDRRDLFLAEANRYELRKPPAFSDDSHGSVARVHELDGRFDDLPKYDLYIQIRSDCDDSLEKRVHPVPGSKYRLQPDLQLRQQVVKAEIR
jgi:hypothetical protein